MLAVAQQRLATDAEAERAPLEFDAIYDAWFDPVCRWARALGGPEADLDDLAQEVFVVVERQLAKFDGRNLAGWLYRITARVVAGQRRRAWFRHLFRRPRDVELVVVAGCEHEPRGSEEVHPARR